MKRTLSFLIALLLFLLSGCSYTEPDTVPFFYYRDSQQYRYFEEDGVICSESRDLMSHRNDLRYMVGLYLAGPMEEGLAAPFTKTTKLMDVWQETDSVYIHLSNTGKPLSDSQFTLSCACLAMTCMNFTSCRDVTIVCGERTITLRESSILLYDAPPAQETTGG